MATYGLEVIDENGQEYVYNSKPFNIIRRITITNLGGIDNYSVNIPNVVAGSSLVVANGHIGGTADVTYDAGGSTLRMDIVSAQFSGTSLNLTMAGGGNYGSVANYTIFAVRN